jgi:uncharacterized protein
VTPLQVLRFDTYRATPWKNGGGVTHEIARSHETGEPDWRLSLATIDRDGPFSDFAGFDRTIVPIDGPGFELIVGGERVVLEPRTSAPFRFAGEEPVECRLRGGRSRDLNAFSRRASSTHEMRSIELSAAPRAIDAPPRAFLFAVGSMTVAYEGRTIEVADGETLACERAVCLEIAGGSPQSYVILVKFAPRTA